MRSNAKNSLLPDNLQQIIEQKHKRMLQHPQYILAPFDRQVIYQAFGSPDDPKVIRARARLALITAGRVLPFWQQAYPHDPWPELLLGMAEQALHDIKVVKTLHIAADEGWIRIERLGDEAYAGGQQLIWTVEQCCAFWAGDAIVTAASEATGRHLMDGIDVEDEITDYIDPTCADTAQSAALAYAGRIGDVYSEDERRKEFWEWWLFEAIPAAWQEV